MPDSTEILLAIASDLAEVKGDVKKLNSAMYGEGTTKGLVTKVDELRTGKVEGAKTNSVITSGLVASLIAGIATALSHFGITK